MEKNYDYLPPVYPPSKYINSYFDEDIRAVSEIFTYYDWKSVASNPVLMAKVHLWGKVEYVKELLHKMFRIYYLTHHELMLLERAIDKAEKEHGIEIIQRYPSPFEAEEGD